MEEGIKELSSFFRRELEIPQTDVRSYSPLTLAYIGDCIYDLIIRTMIVEGGNAPVNNLHKRVSDFVKATAQVEIFHDIEGLLTEEEIAVYKRGRNAKSYTSAKNASITDYRIATGFEALMGYLYLTDDLTRIMELLKTALKIRRKV